MVKITLTANGRKVTADIDPRTLLVDFLRTNLRLTGTHVGCDTSQCGACTVHLNGRSVKACAVLAASCEGAEVVTIEGLSKGDKLHPMQEAFREHHALQCGFCTPGMIMAAVDIVNRKGRRSMKRPSAKSSKAISVAVPAITTSSARSKPAPPPWLAPKLPPNSVNPGQEDHPMTDQGIGASVKRKEDLRFITGKGQYVDDINRYGQTYAVFVRSPVAHATIKSIDTKRGEGRARRRRHLHRRGSRGRQDRRPHLRLDDPFQGRHADEGRRASRARRRQGALRRRPRRRRHRRDAGSGEGCRRNWSTSTTTCMPAVVDLGKSQAAGQPQLHDEAPNNTVYQWHLGDKDATDAAFAKAAHVTKLEIVNNRLIPNAIEPRAAIGDYDAGQGQFTLYTTSQNPHVARLVLSAFIGIAPENKLRVIAPDVGGGFGSKIFIYAEETVCVWAAKKVGRPVKWTAERGEAFLADAHGRDHLTTAELALDAGGKILALRAKTKANLGAYLSTFASSVPTYLYAPLLSGQYEIPAIYCEVDGVYTTTAPVDAYRGAGRPEATFVVERLIEVAARETGRDPAEFRRQNFITAFPHQTPVIMAYDAGDYAACLDKALSMADVKGFAERKAASAKAGKLRGLGFSAYIEACGIAPSQRGRLARRRRRPLGKRGNPRQSRRHRRGAHRLAQPRPGPRDDVRPGHRVEARRADRSGLDRPRRHRQGADGHGHLRLALRRGRRAPRSSRRRKRSSPKASASPPPAWRCPRIPVDFENGEFLGRGTNKKMTFGEVALQAYVAHKFDSDLIEPGLKEGSFYDPKNFTFPSGVHIAEVEIDAETGKTRIDRWTAVDDFGILINPMIVEGQVHGGIAQGIGQAHARAHRLRRERPAPDRQLHGLRHAARRRPAVVQRRDDEHAVPLEPARRQGLRRSRRDRGACGPHERDHRRPRPRGHRHAGDTAGGVARDPENAPEDGGGVRREPCTRSIIAARAPSTRPISR